MGVKGYNIGDSVVIRNENSIKNEYDENCLNLAGVTKGMFRTFGRRATVAEVIVDGKLYVLETGTYNPVRYVYVTEVIRGGDE